MFLLNTFICHGTTATPAPQKNKKPQTLHTVSADSYLNTEQTY